MFPVPLLLGRRRECARELLAQRVDAYLYWDRAKELAAQSLAKQRRRGMTGIEEIRVLLRSYAGLIFTDPAGIRFSLDAEGALCRRTYAG